MKRIAMPCVVPYHAPNDRRGNVIGKGVMVNVVPPNEHSFGMLQKGTTIDELYT